MDQIEQLAEIRENVAYIKAKIEDLPALDARVRSLEQKWWQFPMTAVIALIGMLFHR